MIGVFGVGCVNVNVSAELVGDSPSGVTTRTCTVPYLWSGSSTMILVDETTSIAYAALRPNRTAVTSVKFVPRTVTCVAPQYGPWCRDSPVTVGGVPAAAGTAATTPDA